MNTLIPREPLDDLSGTKYAETWIIGECELRAFRMLRDSTGGTFDFWSLAGPRRAATRAAIASALDGKTVPQAKAGVAALREAFHYVAHLNGMLAGGYWLDSCPALRDRSFAEYANLILAR